MTVRAYYSIACNGCGQLTPGGADDIRDSGAEARQAAKAHGWVFRQGRDYCPVCKPAPKPRGRPKEVPAKPPEEDYSRPGPAAAPIDPTAADAVCLDCGRKFNHPLLSVLERAVAHHERFKGHMVQINKLESDA